MLYKDCILEKMKDIIFSADIDEAFKSTLISYVNEKKDSDMIFGYLCIIHYREFANNNDPQIITIAAAIELIILSFDIMDDLQDNDANYLWCNEPSLGMNATLAMIFLTIKLIHESTFAYKHEALNILNDFALKSINGQYLDLINVCNYEELYINMVDSKSGSLVALSSLIGTNLALGISNPQVAEYSRYIGIIQQIYNDIEGLKLGDRKCDLCNKKFSLHKIFLLENSKVSRNILVDYYEGLAPYLDKEIFDETIVKTGAIHYALAVKNKFKYKALSLLESMQFSEESKHYLKMLIK